MEKKPMTSNFSMAKKLCDPAAIEEKRRLSIEALATAHGTSVSMIHAMLQDDFGLEKKSARWVPKLLNDEQKQQHVEVCSEFVAAAYRHSLAMLDFIVTMDETMVCYHTPQMKKQSQQWIKKGEPGPLNQGPGELDQTDAAHLLRRQGPLLLAHHPQGLYRQRCVHRQVPGCLHDAFEGEEACAGGARVVFLLRQCPCSHRRHRSGLARCPQRPCPPPPALFDGSGTSGLLLVLAGEGRAGGCHIGLRHPQEGVGRSNEKHHRRRVPYHLPAVV
jgi:hypothetical protein